MLFRAEEEEEEEEEGLYRLHGPSGYDDSATLAQHLGEVDRWIQKQELDRALRQRS